MSESTYRIGRLCRIRRPTWNAKQVPNNPALCHYGPINIEPQNCIIVERKHKIKRKTAYWWLRVYLIKDMITVDVSITDVDLVIKSPFRFKRKKRKL